MMKRLLQVFAGTFASRDDACLYTEPQWQPEPDASTSEDEYAAWENRNPTWGFRDDIGDLDLDSDFIETIDGDQRYEYLGSYLVDQGDLTKIKVAAGDANILLLIFPDALGENDAALHSTPRMIYCGAYDFQWP